MFDSKINNLQTVGNIEPDSATWFFSSPQRHNYYANWQMPIVETDTAFIAIKTTSGRFVDVSQLINHRNQFIIDRSKLKAHADLVHARACYETSHRTGTACAEIGVPEKNQLVAATQNVVDDDAAETKRG